MDKSEISRLITESLFREELLNIVDANSIEDLERDVQTVINDYLRDYIIIRGQIVN